MNRYVEFMLSNAEHPKVFILRIRDHEADPWTDVSVCVVDRPGFKTAFLNQRGMMCVCVFVCVFVCVGVRVWVWVRASPRVYTDKHTHR
jgi:hypothetical protein